MLYCCLESFSSGYTRFIPLLLRVADNGTPLRYGDFFISSLDFTLLPCCRGSRDWHRFPKCANVKNKRGKWAVSRVSGIGNRAGGYV